MIEHLALGFVTSVSKGEDPQLELVSKDHRNKLAAYQLPNGIHYGQQVARSQKNVIRDSGGCLHLGKKKTIKRLFARNAAGAVKFAKIWQVLALIHKILVEGKAITQREGYYCLVNRFKNQSEFNATLQDVVALIGCTRASLGIHASSSGAIAGLVSWKMEGSDPINCSTGTTAGIQIPGVADRVSLTNLGARYVLVVEKDAVFTYLCGQRIWDTLPCILVTGCGYPPLSVRMVVRQLEEQLRLPILGLFDYNPHGLRILLTYKHGSAFMGTEAHAYTADIKWLGVHHDDLFNSDGAVPQSSLQSWCLSDQRVFSGITAAIDRMGDTLYVREVRLMAEKKVKAEIEALNNNGLDSLENKIVRKVLRKGYF